MQNADGNYWQFSTEGISECTFSRSAFCQRYFRLLYKKRKIVCTFIAMSTFCYLFVFSTGSYLKRETARRLYEGVKKNHTICEGGNEEQTDVLFPLGLWVKWHQHVDVLKRWCCMFGCEYMLYMNISVLWDGKALNFTPKCYPLIWLGKKVHSWMQPKQLSVGHWRQQGMLFTLTSLTNFPTTLAKHRCMFVLFASTVVLKTWQGWNKRSHNKYQNMAHWALNLYPHGQTSSNRVHLTP